MTFLLKLQMIMMTACILYPEVTIVYLKSPEVLNVINKIKFKILSEIFPLIVNERMATAYA